ncbi:MAG TPA: serine hydrolase [Myxococcota bacterium]|nr:serine hydrolase [Myxococcota bacterium]
MNRVGWQRGPSDCPGLPEPAEWPRVTPAEAGLDPGALESVAERIERRELENVHALLVVRGGKLAFERYFAGEDALWAEPAKPATFDAGALHDVRSVSKSVVGALVGIAHGEGALPDLDAPIARFFPVHARGRESALAGRTLRHALTMSAGLAWDELTHPYYDPRNDEHGLWLAADPLAYGLSRRPVAAPGAAFAYNGSLPVVLAQVVEQATGVPFDRYAVEKLWCPLGVTRAEWVQHPSGVIVSASGLRLTPRAMARFGQMMLDGGRFAGRQIVPPDYARASLEAQVTLPAGFGGATGYGYLWWIGQLPVASGNGGQRIVLDRETGTVIVTTAGLYDSPRQGEVPMQVVAGVLAAYR